MHLKVKLEELIEDYFYVKRAVQDVLDINSTSTHVLHNLPTSESMKLYKGYRELAEREIIEQYETDILEKVLIFVNKEIEEAGINDSQDHP